MNLSTSKNIIEENKFLVSIYSIIISFIPISYILGNLFLNLNLFLILLIGTYTFFKFGGIKLELIDKLIIFLFLFILFTSIFNSAENYVVKINKDDYTILFKSILYIRYLILYFAIRLLIEKNLINLKIIYYFYAASVFFVSVDIIYQFFNGTNILGLKSPFPVKTTGVFYDEAVAGSFIQRFSFFLLYLLPVFFKFKKKILLILLLCFLFTLTLASLYFAANRMSLALFLMASIIILFTTKTLRKNLIIIILFFSLILASLLSINKNFFNHYNAFFHYTINIVNVYKDRMLGKPRKPNFLGTLEFRDNIKIPHHVMEFDTFYGTWKMNPLIGGGLKSFRLLCPKRPMHPKLERTTCNTHPHNYYLEIISDIGLIGLIIISLIFLKIIYNFYFKFNNLLYKTPCSPFFYVFFIEAFPIKSSGSFFTTGNSLIIFLSLSFVVSLASKK